MGKNTKIIATVIPKACEKGSDGFYRLRVNVFLTPRLPDSGSLKDYYEILHWYKYEEVFKQARLLNFSVTTFNKIPNSRNYRKGPEKHLDKVTWIPRPKVKYVIENDGFFMEGAEGFMIDKDISAGHVFWKKMFHPDTPVSGWVISDLSYDFITRRVNINDLHRRMREAIIITIQQISAQDSFETPDAGAVPGRSTAESQRDTSSFILYLEQLKDMDPEVILADPLLSNPYNEFSRPLVNNLYNQLKKFKKDWEDQNSRLTQLLTMPEVEKRNVEETEEFHKRLSAFSQHTQLLKITGWLWEYEIKVTEDDVNILSSAKGDDSVIKFLHIKNDAGYCQMAQSLAPKIDDSNDRDAKLMNLFVQRTLFHYPFTAFRLFKPAGQDDYIFIRGEDPRMSRNYFETDEHNVRIFRSPVKKVHNYEIEPMLIDKVQLFENIGDVVRKLEGQMRKDGPSTEDQNEQHVLQQERKFLQSENVRTAGKPDYVSNGLSVNITNLETIVETSTQSTPANPDHPEQLENADKLLDLTSIVFSHNLDAGYRVDITAFDEYRRIKTGSLCARVETFVLMPEANFPQKNKRLFVTVEATEGNLMESAQLAKDNSLMVDQELFRYNNWSLVAPQPGNHNQQDEALAESALRYYKFDTEIEPLPASVIPLRFGNWYSFQLRLADIAGNGANPIQVADTITFFRSVPFNHLHPENIKVNHRHWTDLVKYYRMDPVQVPVVIPGHRIFNRLTMLDENNKETVQLGWETNRWGEDVQVMVIRSFVEDRDLVCRQNSIRYVGPPKANIHFIIKHGVIDNLLSENPNDLTLRDELLALSEKETFGTDQTFFLKEQQDIEYLFDPVVNGYELILDRKAKYAPLVAGSQTAPGVLSIGRSNPKYYANKRYKTIVLTDLPRTSSRYMYAQDDTRSTVTIQLKQGVEESFDISCTHYSQITNRFRDADPRTSEVTQQYTIDSVFHRCVDRIKRTRIRLIHAVQKPCFIEEGFDTSNNFFATLPADKATTQIHRELNKTEVILDLRFRQFPVRTAEAFILHVEYFEWVSNRKSIRGYDTVLVQKIVKTGFRSDGNGERDVSFSNLRHVFGDTRHRKVNYRIEAISAFKKYYSPAMKDFSVFGEYSKWGEFGNKVGNEKLVCNKWLRVPSSSRPAPPEIEQIVPLITWTRAKDKVIRTCNKIRIYFKGDWYSTGEDEHVAVFLLEPKGNAGSAHVPLSLENVISQFGLDPAARPYDLTKPADRIDALTADDFILPTAASGDLCHSCTDNTGRPAIVSDVRISNLEFDKPTVSDSWLGEKVKAAIYCIRFMHDTAGTNQCNSSTGKAGNGIDVKTEDKLNVAGEEMYDFGELKSGEKALDFQSAEAQLGKFFIDIELSSKIDLGDYYFPFLRFALARYQPNTISASESTDLRFSKIVLTDFVQLLPRRELNISWSNDACSIKYISNAVRKNVDGNSTNMLYIFRQRGSDGLETIEKTNDPIVETAVVEGSSGVDVSATVNRAEQLVVEEYEHYHNRNAPNSTPNPRHNFTKRLVFSHTITK